MRVRVRVREVRLSVQPQLAPQRLGRLGEEMREARGGAGEADELLGALGGLRKLAEFRVQSLL